MGKSGIKINISPKTVVFAMFCIVLVLTTIHSIILGLYFYIGDSDTFGYVDLFDFDIEGNFPSMFSAFNILFASLLLALITRDKFNRNDKDRHYWFGLALIFLFLAFDESIGLHEELGDITESVVTAEGFLYFAWVVPYAILLVLLAIPYLGFLFRLPLETRIRFVIAATLFLGGAIGFEVFSANEADLHSTSTLKYSVLYTIEEIMEMSGVIVFIHALLLYIDNYAGSLNLTFSNKTED